MAIADKHKVDWGRDCIKWRGRVLSGVKAHWCYDWDGLPVDETCPEWPCNCKKTEMKRTRLYFLRNSHGETAEIQVASEKGMELEKECDRLRLTVSEIIERPICEDIEEQLDRFAMRQNPDKGAHDV